MLAGLDCEALARECELRAFVDGDGSIWERADMHDRVLVVAHGRFRVVRRARRPSAPRVLLRFAYERSVLGVSQLVEQTRTTDVFAAPRGGALVVAAAALRTQIAKSPSVAFALLRDQRRVMADLLSEIEALRTEKFGPRVLRCIARFVDRGQIVGNRARVELCQRELAEMNGGSPPDVSKALRAFLPTTVLACRNGVIHIEDVAQFRRVVNDLDRVDRVDRVGNFQDREPSDPWRKQG